MLLLKGEGITRRYRRLSRRAQARPYVNKRGMLDFQLAHRDLTPYDLARFGVTTTGANGMVWDVALGKYVYAPHNLVTRSTAIGASPWLGGNGGTGFAPTITQNYATAPDGTQTASRVQLNKGAGADQADFSRIYQAPATGITANTEYFNASVWLKSNDGGTYQVLLSVTNNADRVLVTVGPEWARATIPNPQKLGATSAEFRVEVRGSYGTSSSADILMWGAKLSRGTVVFDDIQTAGSAVWLPRVDYDPLTGSPRGVLAEPAYQNLATYSADFSNAVWSGSGYSKGAAVSLIDGGVAQKITSTGTTSMVLTQLVGKFTGSSETAAFLIEQGNTDYCHVELYNSTGSTVVASASLQYSNGNCVLAAGSGTPFSAKLKGTGPNGGAVYLLAITGTGTAGANRRIQARPNVSSASVQVGDYFYIHSAALVTGSVAPISPIVTQGSAVTRSGDTASPSLPSWVAGRQVGLNLISNGDFSNGTNSWNTNTATVSVVGGEAEITATGSLGRIEQPLTVESGKAYLLAVTTRRGTATGNANISVSRGGTGGFAVLGDTSVSATTNTTIAMPFVATGSDIIVKIGHAGSSGTVFADNVTLYEIDTSVTMMAEYEVLAYNDASARTVALLSDGTANNRIYERILSTTTMDYGVVAGNIGQGGSQTNNVSALIGRVCGSASLNDLRAAFNGVGSNVDPLGSVPAGLNRLDIGHSLNGAQVNGWVRRVCLVAGASLQSDIIAASVEGF